MTQEEAKAILPIIEAVAEGRVVQFREDNGKWVDYDPITEDFNIEGFDWRVKPSPRTRPFKDGGECWQEMQKHLPFGWLQDTNTGELYYVTSVLPKRFVCSDGVHYYDPECWDFIFVDGTPFSIKEEQ